MTPGELEDFKRQVQEFASSDAVEQLLIRLEDEYTQSWKNSAPHETDKRTYSYMMVRAVEALRNEIKSIAIGDRFNSWNREQKSKIV